MPYSIPYHLVLIVPVVIGIAGVFILYFPVLEKLFGRTLGKRLLRIRVVKESGVAISIGDAIIRRLSYYFDILALDALFIFFTKKRQRAFDIVYQTVVIREPYLRRTWITSVIIVLIILIPFLYSMVLLYLVGVFG